MSVNTKVNGQLVPSAGLYKVSVPIQSGDIYSFEERQIGVWADGKPLYQKTIDFGALPNNASKSVAHGIANIEEVIDYECLAYSTSNGYHLAIPYVNKTNPNQYNIQFDIDATNIYIVTSADRTAYDICRVTLKYTKTTDVAGSGIYVPSGDKAEHYSTDEEVIGTFLGETLYRKVIPITANWDFTANNWVKSNIPIGNIKALINGRIEIFYNNTYSLHFVQLGVVDNMIAGNSFRQFSAVANGANLILEYTKTS